MFYLSEQSRNKYSEIIQRRNPRTTWTFQWTVRIIFNPEKLGPWIPDLENVQFDTQNDNMLPMFFSE